MKLIKLEPVSADDAEVIAKWLAADASKNLYDKDVFFYPSTLLLKTSTADEPIAFLPAQLTLTIDSPAFNPNATKLQIALSLKKLMIEFVTRSYERGVREVNFFTASDDMAEFAIKHGFEEIKYRLFRLKLPQSQ